MVAWFLVLLFSMFPFYEGDWDMTDEFYQVALAVIIFISVVGVQGLTILFFRQTYEISFVEWFGYILIGLIALILGFIALGIVCLIIYGIGKGILSASYHYTIKHLEKEYKIVEGIDEREKKYIFDRLEYLQKTKSDKRIRSKEGKE